MKYAACLTICVLLMPMSFASKVHGCQSPEQATDETYSFENDFEGWRIRSNQSEPNLPPAVVQTQERATDGLTALEFTIPK